MHTPDNWLRALSTVSKKSRSTSLYLRRRFVLQKAFPHALVNLQMVAARRPEVVRKWLNIRSSADEFNADVPEEGEEEGDGSEEEETDGGYIECPDLVETTAAAVKNRFSCSELDADPERPSSHTLHRWQSEPLSSHLLKSQEYRISVGTWNVGGRSPPDLFDLEEWLDTTEPADIYVLGFQEIVPLNAGNVLGAEDDGPAVKWDGLIRQTLDKKYGASKARSYSTPASPTRAEGLDRVRRLSSITEGVVHRDEASALLEDTIILGPGSTTSFQQQKNEIFARRKAREFSRTWSSFVSKPAPDDLAINKLQRTMTERDDNVYITEETVVSPISSPPHSRGSSATKSSALRQGYFRVASKQMVGIFISVWVRTDLRRFVHNIKVSCVGLGLMGYLGNKGSVAISLSLHQTSFCFVCTHLTSGTKEGDELRRNSDVADILKKTHFPRSAKSAGQDLPETILAHDRIIWLGDLNYRLTLSDKATRQLIAREQWDRLLAKDQLKLEQSAGRVFDGWHEGTIYFAPTYKYVLDSDVYFGESQKSGEKQRPPAWCDRILWYGKGLRLMSYVRSESKFSDHRPVNAAFMAEVELVSRKFKRPQCEDVREFEKILR